MAISPYDPNSGWEGYDKMQPVEPARATTAARFTVNSVTDGIIVPGLKSVILAVPAGLLAGLLAGAFHWGVNIWYLIPGVMLAVFLFTFWRSSAWWNATLEKMLGLDLNRDGYIGQPAPLPPALPAEKITVEVVQNGGTRGDILSLPCGREKLTALATGLVQGRQFAQSVWTGNGALFTRAEFEETRQELIRAGLLAWNKPGYPAQGVSITSAGKSIFRRLAGDHSPTAGE